MQKPNFLIIGLARSGTTSMYHYLRQHPNIFLPSIKEPKFFSGRNIQYPHNGKGDKIVDDLRILNEQEYYSLFDSSNGEKAIGEASSDYFYHIKECYKDILSELGNETKIIICLRDPYERSFSAYNNLIRDSRETLSFSEGLLQEDYRIGNNYDWMWHYLEGSLYHDKLKLILENFHDVHLVFFEDIKNNIDDTLKNICKFLCVDQSFSFRTETKYSRSGKPKNTIIKIISRRYGIFYKARKVIMQILPRVILERLSTSIFKKETINSDCIEILKPKLNNDIDKLEDLLNINFNHWKR